MNSVWLINDQMGLRQTLLRDVGLRTMAIDRHMHSIGERDMLLQQLAVQKPDLLWLKLIGWGTGSGHRVERRRAVNMTMLCEQQLSTGRRLLLEAGPNAGAWDLAEYQGLLKKLTISKHAFCNFGARVPGKDQMINKSIQFAASFPITDNSECQCGQPIGQHRNRYDKLTTIESNQMMERVLKGTVMKALCLPESLVRGDTAMDDPSQVLPLRFDRQKDSQVNPHRLDAQAKQVSQRSSVRISRRQNKATDSGDDKAHDMAPSTEPEDNLLPRHSQSALLAELLGRQFKSVAFAEDLQPEAAYPTEQAVRQKESLKARKEAGGEIKKKKQTIEQHADDCGTDLTGIEADIAGFVHPFEEEKAYWQHEVEELEYLTYGGASSSTAGNPERLARWLASRHWLFGSSAAENVPFDAKVVACDGMETFLTQAKARAARGQVDVMELFGGTGETSRILVRRYNSSVGTNFDLTCGINLRSQRHIALLFEYVEAFKPVVAIMAPPCTGLKGWAGINAQINPHGHHMSVENSKALGRLASRIAAMQLDGGRHFVAENPVGSALWNMPEWQTICPRVARCRFDQCQVGLKRRKPPCLPIMKPTELWASHPALIRRFANKHCKRDHQHAVIGGDVARGITAPSKEAQIWPNQMCKLLAAGVQEVLECHYRGTAQSFPSTKKVKATEGTRIRDSDRVEEEEAEAPNPHSASSRDPDPHPADPIDRSSAATRQSTCPACRGHTRADHPRHTRNADCSYRDIGAGVWTCPGCIAIPEKPYSHASHRKDHTCRWGTITCEACKSNKPRGDPGHSLDVDCKWGHMRSVDKGKTRKGHHPRDPRIPAAGEPTSTLRIGAPAPAEAGGTGSGGGGGAAKGSSSSHPKGPGKVESSTQAGQDDLHRDGAPAAAAPRPIVPANSGGGPIEPASAAQEGRSWSEFDLGSMLQELRSVREGVVRRCLRKLHLRWWHAPAKRMRELLQHAGASREVLPLIDEIVDTCRICRNWTRPGPKAVSSSRLSTKFNETVQVDLLFHKKHVILHMIDECTRWTVTALVPDQEQATIMEAMKKIWFKLYDYPSTLISDQEGAVSATESAAHLESHNCKLLLRAKGQHANMVERHHEILRDQLRRLEDQANTDGLKCGFDSILSEATLSKNCLVSVGGRSPYEAIYGRTPPLLGALEANPASSPDDRDEARLRELAVQSMVDATAKARMQRADKSKTRPAGELQGLAVGDLVEFYRPPPTKDVSGWHGPATVTDLLALDHGIIGIRWQGRSMTCRTQDVRRALLYPVFLTRAPVSSPMEEIRNAAGHLRDVHRLGWVQAPDGGKWVECRDNKLMPRVMLAGLQVASCHLHLDGCVSMRIGRGARKLEGIANMDDGLLLWWHPKRNEEVMHCSHAPSSRINLEALFGEDWSNIAFIQFLCVDQDKSSEIRRNFPDVPNLGGPYDPGMAMLREVPANWGGNRTAPNEDDPDAPGGNLKRPRSAAESENPRPTGTSRTTREEQQQTTANGNFDDVDWDAISDENFGPEAGYHLMEADMTAMQYESNPPDPWYYVPGGSPELFTDLDVTEPVELSFHGTATQLLTNLPSKVPEGCEVVYKYNTVGEDPEAVIERTHNVLTREEALMHVEECREAILKELQRWHHHQAWERAPRASARNLLTSKWVLKWKDVEGKRIIKARLTVQGFKDRQQVDNYAGTTSRWGQRLILIIAAQMKWSLHSADVSEAFLRGLSFEEVAKEPGETMRACELQLPPGCTPMLRELKGMEHFNEVTEVLRMLKPGYGLKDAPRLWNKALKRVLAKVGLQATCADKELYVKHHNGVLILILSTHVDDLKFCGKEDECKALIKALEEAFEKMTLHKGTFEHLGIKHVQHADFSIEVAQGHYADQLRAMADDTAKRGDPEAAVTMEIHAAFRSLLGGVAWMTQTRPDIVVYVSALQRVMAAPLNKHVVALNKVLRYIKSKPLKSVYRAVPNPWKLLVISDSAFKAEDQDCLAVRSGLIALASKEPVAGTANSGSSSVWSVQPIEHVCKKQQRICRSTYAAELHSALDLTGLALLILGTLTEVLTGAKNPVELLEIHNNGGYPVECELFIDARAVFDSVTAKVVKTPADKILLLHALALRDHLEAGQLSKLNWIDTRDMVADALNKGTIDRGALRQFFEHGQWKLCHDVKSWRFGGVDS